MSITEEKNNIHKCKNTKYRNTEILITEIPKYNLQKYKKINYRNTEIPITQIHKYK